jgi:hypothetical protein
MSSKPQEIVIDINPTGKVEGMHFDQFDLGFLGDKRVERASEIMHNSTTQKWDIVLPGMTLPVCDSVQGFDGYDTARNFEVSWLQACRKEAVHPNDPEGVHLASTLRDNMMYSMCQCGGGDCSECPR